MAKITDLDTLDPTDRHVNPLDTENREYHATHSGRKPGRPFGVKPRSCYASTIGDSPVLAAGDRAGARRFLLRVESAIDQGGWSSLERTRLYRLRDKWRSRASGQDRRFNLVGTRPGRLSEDQEYALHRGKRQDAKSTPAKTDRRRKVYDFSEFDITDELHPVPQGYAKGGPDRDTGTDLDGDAGDDEMGEPVKRGTVVTDKDFIISGTDHKGHAHRVQCRLMPAHFRALTAIKDEGRFPFKTLGDIVRWSIYRGLRELQELKRSAKVESHMLQVAAIHDVLTEEMAQAEFAGVFDAMAEAITKHIQDQAIGEARRVAAIVKGSANANAKANANANGHAKADAKANAREVAS